MLIVWGVLKWASQSPEGQGRLSELKKKKKDLKKSQEKKKEEEKKSKSDVTSRHHSCSSSRDKFQNEDEGDSEMDLEPHSYWHQKTKSGTTKPGLNVPIFFFLIDRAHMVLKVWWRYKP